MNNYMRLTLSQKIANKKRKGKSKTLRPINSKRSIEKKYYNAISKYIKSIVANTEKQLMSVYNSYTKDLLGTDLMNTIAGLRYYYNQASDVENAVQTFIDDLSVDNKNKFYNQINNIFGVSLQEIILNEDLSEALALANQQNVKLIKTIPENYFNRIENLVMANLTSGNTQQLSLKQQIQKLGQSTDYQAKRIARDQTSKINAAMTKTRAENLGSTKYEWSTSLDERVRDTHKVNNGKIFEWDKPPAITGHPSHDINCRCVALPIIDIDNI